MAALGLRTTGGSSLMWGSSPYGVDGISSDSTQSPTSFSQASLIFALISHIKAPQGSLSLDNLTCMEAFAPQAAQIPTFDPPR